jgi:hypothetical protein
MVSVIDAKTPCITAPRPAEPAAITTWRAAAPPRPMTDAEVDALAGAYAQLERWADLQVAKCGALSSSAQSFASVAIDTQGGTP